MKKLNNFQIDDIIKLALKEDLIFDDITTNAIYQDKKVKISLIAKEKGILAGLDVFKRTFTLLDDTIEFVNYKKDGDEVKRSDIVLEIQGDIKTILTAERVALNFLQRMSGIATQTKAYIDALDDSNIKIFDTRKTTPGMRILEKYAVRMGGGCNHRYNLSDGILIKDNHIDAAGSVKKAIQRLQAYTPFIKKVEVEVETLAMVKEAVEAGADIIMLDNMDIDTVKESIKIINKKAIIECSGNIDLTNISRYRGLAVDYLSSGSLTNNIKALDLSLKNLIYLD